ncbi:MAG: hypothetical protein E7437_03840 [Ruminococcaceae bacterium]|nr:hypothetical protein [Oscillospiraceae bacterium]
MKKWVFAALCLLILLSLPQKATAAEVPLELGRTVSAQYGESYWLTVQKDCTVAIYRVSDSAQGFIRVYNGKDIAAEGFDQVLLEARAGVTYRVILSKSITYMVEQAAVAESVALDCAAYSGYPEDRFFAKIHRQPENALLLVSQVRVSDPEVVEVTDTRAQGVEFVLKKPGQSTLTLEFHNGFTVQTQVTVNAWPEFTVGQTLTLEGEGRTWKYRFSPEKTGTFVLERRDNNWGFAGMQAFTADGRALSGEDQSRIEFRGQAGEEIWIHFTLSGMGEYVVSTREAGLSDLCQVGFYQADGDPIYTGERIQPYLRTDLKDVTVHAWEFDEPDAFVACDGGYIPQKAGTYTVTAVLDGGERITQALTVEALTVETLTAYEDFSRDRTMDRCAYVPDTTGEYVFTGPVDRVSCDGVTLLASQTGHSDKGDAVVYRLEAGKTYLVELGPGNYFDFTVEPMKQGEYRQLGRREVHYGDVLIIRVEPDGFIAGSQPQWQWESSDPVVLSAVDTVSGLRDVGSGVKWKTGKPGKAVITATSDQGHSFQMEVEVYTNAIRHGLRLVKEGADLKLERGKEKDLKVVLPGDPKDFHGIRIVRNGVFDDTYSPYIDKRGLAVTPGAEKSGEFAVTIPCDYLSQYPSGTYYVCYEGLKPEPVSKLMILESDSSLLSWILLASAVLLLAAVLTVKPRRRKAADNI